MAWRPNDPQGDEAGKVKFDVVQYTRGVVLDLGCGPKKAFPHFLGVDSCKDTDLFGIAIKPDLHVLDCADLSATIEDASVDAVFSSHLLEHIDDYKAALQDWWRCIKVGGYLVLYLPHKAFYPNIGQPGANPDHVHDFEPADIIDAMRDAEGGWDLVEREDRNEGNEYSFLLVFKKLETLTRRFGWMLDAFGRAKRKTVCVVRYGGFGDMLQAANILPALKRQGYRVTVMTTPKGQNILRHDPNIDEWFIQDDDQVPNHELSAFWSVATKKFDKFVNLCESVEGTLLAMPGRANHMWPDKVRRRHLGQNYLEFTSDLADVPYASESVFYPTEAEEAEARARLGDGLNIVWALSGSSCHKFYPGQDNVIAMFLVDHPDCRIFLVGDAACQILEAGWEKEPRVVCLAGQLGIRDTLALAKVADIVIGCETGVLNAVAFEPSVRKVCLLSHSSHENLTKHWINSRPLAPVGLSCYPCHRLHYTREFCREDAETGAALCMRMIDPADVYEAAVAK